MRKRKHALIIDLGTGLQRLITSPSLLDGVDTLDVILTHFHLDHVCGIAYLPALGMRATIHAPGYWLANTSAADVLAPLLTAPISPFGPGDAPAICELNPGTAAIQSFEVSTTLQPKHWSPTVGIRIDDSLAVVTDTGYHERSVRLADGVTHLLHEAWSASPEQSLNTDASGADAGLAAAGAQVKHLTLIHLNPTLPDHTAVLRDARRHFPRANLGEDGVELSLD